MAIQLSSARSTHQLAINLMETSAASHLNHDSATHSGRTRHISNRSAQKCRPKIACFAALKKMIRTGRVLNFQGHAQQAPTFRCSACLCFRSWLRRCIESEGCFDFIRTCTSCCDIHTPLRGGDLKIVTCNFRLVKTRSF